MQKKRSSVKERKIPATLWMDKIRIEQTGESFGRSIRYATITKNDEILLEKYLESADITYQFDRASSKNLNFKITKIDTWGRRTAKLWLTLISYSKIDNSLDGTFTLADICRTWGIKGNGKIYQDIKNSMGALFYGTISFGSTKKWREKKWNVHTLAHFIDKIEVLQNAEDESEILFGYRLNKEVLGISSYWVERPATASLPSITALPGGILDNNQPHPGFVRIPTSELKKERDTRYINFVERLRLVPPYNNKISFGLIARDWIKFDPDTLRKKQVVINTLLGFCDQAIKDGILIRYTVEESEKKKDWKEKSFVFFRKEVETLSRKIGNAKSKLGTQKRLL